MSVNIIPTTSHAEAQLLTDSGRVCNCRKNSWRSKAGKDVSGGPSLKNETLVIDLGPSLADTIHDVSNPVSVFINCGSVPVEERRFWDVTVVNSDRSRKGQNYRNIRIDENNDENLSHNLGATATVFRVLIHPRNLLVPTGSNKEVFDAPTRSMADNKKLTFRILFQPHLPNLVYSKTFFIWIDTVPVRLKCRGFSIGPAVCLSRNLLNFGGVYLGNSGKKSLELHNNSLSPARFQFQTDNIRGTFKICPPSGIIQPLGSVKVEVTFHPFASRSFYRRMYCIVHHQEPLLFDCLGICVPQPRFLPVPISFGVKIDTELAMPTPIDTFEEFTEGDFRWGIKLEMEKIDFGYRDPDASYPDRTSGISVQAKSSLPYDTLFEWIPDPSKVFSISPACLTLPAKGSQSFSVNFKPSFAGAFYNATLECYVYPTIEAWEQNKPPWSFDLPLEESKTDVEPPVLVISKGKHQRPASAKEKDAKSAASDTEHGSASVRTAKKSMKAESNGKEDVESVIGAIQTEGGITAQDLLPTEYGYPMRVKMARLNEGQESEFLVSPVSDKINAYDLPDVLRSDEEISKHLRASKSTAMAPLVDYDEECATLVENENADGIKSQDNLRNTSNPSNNMGEVNVAHDGSIFSLHGSEGPSPAPEKGTTIDQDDANANNSSIVPSIHPSKLFVPGNDQGSQFHEVLDGPKRIALPLCITLKATGHTFTPQRVPFIPNVKFPLKAVMYASTPNCPVGRTILIKNMSDLPCFYNMEQLDALDSFQVRPFVGLIHGNQHEIIVARMIPKTEHNALYHSDLGITFNIQDNCLLGLFGYCEVPCLDIRVLYESAARGNEIVCPITIAGCVAYTFIELHNPSGFHYRFWLEPADVEEEDWMIISPQPSQGFIAPNETITITWKFAPRADGMYYLFWRFCFEAKRTCIPTEISLGYYEFIIPFTGVAKTSYLKAEPSVLDFDMIQIFDTKSKVTFVRNIGECPVNAHFIVHHEQWLTNFPPEIVSVQPSKLSLKPQESAPITITVRPSKTSIQHFYIIYNLEFNDDDEFVQGASMDVFEKHLVDITFMGDHTVFKFTDILMDSTRCIWDAQQCWSMFSLSLSEFLIFLQIYHLMHHAMPEGTIPHVSSVSFRFPPAPINSPPYVFKLHLSNISELKGYWAVLTSPPRGWKRYLQQRACTTCGTSEFKDGHFTDSPHVATQLWAKKFGGSYHKIPNSCNNIKDLSLFEITPTNGSLKSKESQVITLKYSFTSLGTHEVSILLRIFPAIYVWLDLTGTTLDVNQPYLQLMNKRMMALHPVCLSDMDPPVQMFWLFNGGNTVASFSVDLEPFEKLKDENFGHAVIECLTPKGDVQPKSWSAIKLKFSPLEYTNYSAPLYIYPNYDKTPSHVIVHGTAALNPSVSLRPAEINRKHVLFSNGVPVTLSPSHVAISHLIPTGHSVTRIVFLTNLHARNTMKYFWESMPIEGGGLISFIPNCGRLAPKEEVACKVIIKAGDTAAVLSSMITCTIEDETANVLYEFVLNQWRDYAKNAQLRDSERSSNELGHKPEKPEVYNRLLAVSLYIGSVFGQYDNINPREKSRMGFAAPFSCEEISVDALSHSPFTAKGSQFCQSIICDMIWDMIQSSNFASFIRQATKRKAPMFEEYADAEQNNSITEQETGIENDHEQKLLPVSSTADVLARSIFNIMHEMAERYARSSTKSNWHEIPPVQPKALIDVETHKSLFQS